MNDLFYQILLAVAEDRVTRKTRMLALRMVNKEDRRRERAAAREVDAHVEKTPVPSVEHHKKERRAEERACEEVADSCWTVVLARSAVDHRGRCACEACHKERPLEPHHLMMGAGGRVNDPELVMALCADCHRLGADAAHRRVRHFALEVGVPWCRAHLYPFPNRKEYRDVEV